MMAGSIALGVGLLVLLVAAMNSKSTKPCTDVRIRFTPEGGQRYTGKDLVLTIMNSRGIAAFKGKPVKGIDLKSMEERLEQHPWIGNAELYFDNKRVLQVKIEEKVPIARVFTPKGSSFYIDSNLRRLPLNERYTPRLPVFTGFPTDRAGWKGKDSALMAEVKNIALFLKKDSFWMAQVDQVDINDQRQFELWPKVGSHQVLFGNGADAAEKFHKLTLFYQQVLAPAGFNAYIHIDLRFSDQVVAVPQKTKYARTDTVLYKQWYRQWQAMTQQAVLHKTVSTPSPVKTEGPDHPSTQAVPGKMKTEGPDRPSAKPVPNPVKTNPSTLNPVPGKQKDTGTKSAVPVEKPGLKAVMPSAVKTS
jgi:cell division protein FtsQ